VRYLTNARTPGAVLSVPRLQCATCPAQPPPDWLEKVKQREPGLSDKRAKLVALIEHLDAGIGRVLATLERLQLADNTLVIFTFRQRRLARR